MVGQALGVKYQDIVDGCYQDMVDTMIPPEPPVAEEVSRNGAQGARARGARRSGPLRTSTVVALGNLDGRLRRDQHPAGGL